MTSFVGPFLLGTPSAYRPRGGRIKWPTGIIFNMETSATVRSNCPVCGEGIEPGEMTTESSAGWVHAHCADPEPGEPGTEREFTGDNEDQLTQLVEELGNVFPGCYGIEAEIETRDFGGDNEELIASNLFLYFHPDEEFDEVSEEEFLARSPHLYWTAKFLLEQLSIEGFDGERFPDGMFWPKSLY